MGKIIAIANQKGGVGKTTSSVNIAAGLGRLGKRVLIIDMDPQGNASTGFGIAPGQRQKTVYEILKQQQCCSPQCWKLYSSDSYTK